MFLLFSNSPTPLQMNRQATWIFLITTQRALFKNKIGTCLHITLTGGATQAAAQEKEELQPSAIYETHSRKDKSWTSEMTQRGKPMGYEPEPQKKGVYQASKTRLFSCPPHSGTGRINTPLGRDTPGSTKAPGKFESLCNLFSAFFISFNSDLEQSSERSLWFLNCSVAGRGYLPGYWAGLDFVSALAFSGAIGTKQPVQGPPRRPVLCGLAWPSLPCGTVPDPRPPPGRLF